MKKYLFFLVFLLATSVTYAQTVINPKIGINASRLSTDPDGGQVKARIGYQIGLDARIGDRVYFQPGLFYFKQSSQLKTQRQLENNQIQNIESDLNRQGFQLLTQVGFNIVDGDGFKFRVNAGPAISVITAIAENDYLSEDDFKGTNLTGNVGLGFDIFFLTVDYNYEFGFSNVFESNALAEDFSFSDDPKIARSTFNVGLKFEF